MRSVRVSCHTMAGCIGFAGSAIPDHRRLALVGDADGRQVRRSDAGLAQRSQDDFLRASPDLERIVLDPARSRIDLAMLALVDGDHLSAMVDDHEPRARRALVEGAYVLRHRGILADAPP